MPVTADRGEDSRSREGDAPTGFFPPPQAPGPAGTSGTGRQARPAGLAPGVPHPGLDQKDTVAVIDTVRVAPSHAAFSVIAER